jgi:hypothetical protein
VRPASRCRVLDRDDVARLFLDLELVLCRPRALGQLGCVRQLGVPAVAQQLIATFAQQGRRWNEPLAPRPGLVLERRELAADVLDVLRDVDGDRPVTPLRVLPLGQVRQLLSSRNISCQNIGEIN